jgi:endonuclease YncB( thermonuclease family)
MGNICMSTNSDVVSIATMPRTPTCVEDNTVYPDADLVAATLQPEDFSYCGLVVTAKILSVYDGDTLRAAFRTPAGIIQYKFRINGINAPEYKNIVNHHQQIDAAGAAARNALVGKLSPYVQITCGRFDKYGRILATIITDDGTDISTWMVANGHAVSYFGGKK